MNKNTFDVPQTDEEVLQKFSVAGGYSAQIADCLRGIYQCRRAQGESLLRAYEITLLAHVEPEKDYPIEPEK